MFLGSLFMKKQYATDKSPIRNLPKEKNVLLVG